MRFEPPHGKYGQEHNRSPRDRPGERTSKEHEVPLTPIVKEYNHGKGFPALKLGLCFPRRANHRETGEREWTSPLAQRQHYKDRREQKSSYNVPWRYSPPADPHRPEVPLPLGTVVHRNTGPIGQQPPVTYECVPHQGGPQHFENFPGQQSHLQFYPQCNLQPFMRPMGPPIYKNPMVPQQNFPMAPQQNFPMAPQQNFPMAPQQNFPIAPQCFPEPMNPQFPPPSVVFPGQQNIQQAGNFIVQPQFSQPGPAAFYNPAAPAFGLQQPVMGNMNQPFLPQNPVPFPQQDPKVGPPENHLGQVEVNGLLSKLISTGIIKPSQPEATPTSSSESSSVPPAAPPVEKEQEVDKEDTPGLTSFSTDTSKQHNRSVVTRPNAGKQCRQCCMCFTADEAKIYADHLDWHFRQNQARKEERKKCRWYYSYTHWTELTVDLGEDSSKELFEEEIEQVKEKRQAAAKEKPCQRTRATKFHVNERCETCREAFQTYWVDEEEDWFLQNAIRVDNKIFHPLCIEDYKKNTSS